VWDDGTQKWIPDKTIVSTLGTDDTTVPTSGAVTTVTNAHSTLITARATKTTAAMSVYVDKAATGAGDGTSWTDAFTTIQAAINSLPTVLEHAVTIYIRKGTTTYSETLTIQQLTGKGSLTIRGEYYWNGQCAAANTAAANKFRLTATDGANIASGDPVLITSGTGGSGSYKYYVFTTVSSVSDIGSNVYEVTLSASLDSGNIGTTEYYTILKTSIGGSISMSNCQSLFIIGLSITASGVDAISATNTRINEIHAVFGVSDRNVLSCTTEFSQFLSVTSSYLRSTSASRCAVWIQNDSLCIIGLLPPRTGTAAQCCVLSSAVTNVAYGSLLIFQQSGGEVWNSIIECDTNGAAFNIIRSSSCLIRSCTILSATCTGIFCATNSSAERVTINNNATTPLNPATSTDASYIK